MKESQDIDRAKESLAAAQRQKADFEAQVQAEVQQLGGALDPAEAWTLSRVDEDWQAEQGGEDAEAAEAAAI